MISLRPEEKLLKIVHKHWFTLVIPGIIFILLVLLPTFLIGTLYSLPLPIDRDSFPYLINFLLSVYMMYVILFAFVVWIDYYLDVWIVTSHRIIDIEQFGLFNRQVSEIPLERIQDITIDIKGIIETLLHFGTIRIQTAGEREFFIKSVPHLQEIKDLVLRYSRQSTTTEEQHTFGNNRPPAP